MYDLPSYVTVYHSALDEYVAVFQSSPHDGPSTNLLQLSVAVISTL